MTNIRDKYLCIDTNGKEHYVTDLALFCYAHYLSYGAMVNVANGYQNDYQGWKCLHYRDTFDINKRTGKNA